MALTKEQREEIIKKYQRGDLDTGSSEVQIALLTYRITDLTQHFTIHKKDVHGRRGLVSLVNRRRKLLDYLKVSNNDKYQQILKDLEIRK
jgi:small subunit ribosomal protein S15